jgi:hypothetical protein
MNRLRNQVVFAVLVGLYKVFVLMHLWNWFATPVFHIPSISLVQMLGLFLIVEVCLGSERSEWTTDYWGKRILAVLDCCIPEDRKGDAKRLLEESAEEGWYEMGQLYLSELASATAILIIGWGIHTYLP